MSASQPRLLFCSFDVLPGPSGASRRVTEYLKLVGSRLSVVVLSAKTQDHSHIERYHGSRLLRVPVGGGDFASRLQAFERAVRRQLESEEYGVAHFTDPFGGYVLSELRAQYGYKLVYEANAFPSVDLKHTHPAVEQDRRFLARVRRQELFCLMNADRVLVGSELTRRHVQALGVGADQIEVVRAPVDLTPFTPKTMGAPDGRPMRLLYLGSQAPWQGLPTLLRAVAEANKRADVRLAVIGPSHPEHQLRLIDLTEELHLAEKVAFQAPVAHEDLHKVLAAADACVAPLEDGERNRLQGGALAKLSEYLAAGRPVIASDVPIARELVPAGAGLFFKAGSVEELSARILELERDPARRIELGQRARAEAKAVDGAVISRRLLSIYEDLLGRSAGSTEAGAGAPTALTATPTNKLTHSHEATGRIAAPGAPEPQDSSKVPTDRTQRPSGPPVVLGTPVREGPWSDTSRVGTDPAGRAGEPPPGLAPALPAPPRAAPRPSVQPAPAPAPMPQTAPQPAHPAPAPQPPPPVRLEAKPVPSAAGLTARPVRFPSRDEPEEIDPDEVMEADEVSMVSRLTRIDPWFAQLVHGYCPPEGIQFGRHTPPTTFPGREDTPPPRSDGKP